MARKTIEVDAIFGRIEAFENDLITTQITSFGAHTRVELALLLQVIQPGDTVFDIGGHIGTFAIPIAHKVGSTGRVVAVEGNRPTFAVLCRNINRLNLGNVVYPVHKVIGLVGNNYEVREYPSNTGATFFLPTDGLENQAIGHLDDLLNTYSAPRVVKLDIEGLEFIALRQSPQLLALKPIIYSEVVGAHLIRYGESVEEFDRLLRERGYRLFRNVGDRNARHDRFVVQELPPLSGASTFVDVLAVHCDDPRLQIVQKMATQYVS